MVYKGIQGYTRAYMGTRMGILWVYNRYTRVYKGIHGYTRVYFGYTVGIQGYT